MTLSRLHEAVLSSALGLPDIWNRQRPLRENRHSSLGPKPAHPATDRGRDIVAWQHFRAQDLFIRQLTVHQHLRSALDHHLHNHLPLFRFLCAYGVNQRDILFWHSSG